MDRHTNAVGGAGEQNRQKQMDRHTQRKIDRKKREMEKER